MIKVGEAEGSVRLPKVIVVDMEIFKESGLDVVSKADTAGWWDNTSNPLTQYEIKIPKDPH